MAQRLVRKICQKCRVSQEVNLRDLNVGISDQKMAKHFSGPTLRLYRGKGCAACHQTGYIGRIGIFEVLGMSEALRAAVVEGKNADELIKIALTEGMVNLMDDALEKVKQGLTTLEEVVRVTRE